MHVASGCTGPQRSECPTERAGPDSGATRTLHCRRKKKEKPKTEKWQFHHRSHGKQQPNSTRLIRLRTATTNRARARACLHFLPSQQTCSTLPAQPLSYNPLLPALSILPVRALTILHGKKKKTEGRVAQSTSSLHSLFILVFQR